MKNKFKTYLKLGILLFGISITFTNCEKDDSPNINTTRNSLMNIKRISLNNFENKDAVNKSIDEVTLKGNNTLNRIVYDSANDFYIDTDDIILMEQEGYHWLTFSVTRDNGTGLENLILKHNITDNSYTSYIAEYEITEDEIDLIRNGGNIPDIVNKMNIYPLTNFNTNILARGPIIHHNADGSCYVHGSSYYGPDGEILIEEIPVDCPPVEQNESLDPGDSTSGGGPTGECDTCPDYEGIPVDNSDTTSSSTNTGPSGTASSDNDTTDTSSDDTTDNEDCLTADPNGNCFNIATSPNPPKPAPDPCEQLKKRLKDLVNVPNIKTHINGLLPGIFDPNNVKEDGVRFAKISDTQYIPRYPDERLNQGVDYDPDYGSNEVLSIHIHQLKYYDATISANPYFNAPVPSDEDLIELMKNVKYIYENNTNLVNEVTQLVMTEAGVFAIVMDPQSAISTLESLEDEDTLKKFKEDFERKVLAKWRKINQNAGEVCDGNCLENTSKRFKNFVKNNKVSGNKLKSNVLEAVMDQNNEITDWICN